MFGLRRRPLTLLASAAITSVSAALAAPFEIEDLYRLAQVGQITVSPNGEAIAYRLHRPNDILSGGKDGRGTSEVYVASGTSDDKLYLAKDVGARSLDWRDADTMTYVAKGDDDAAPSLYEIDLSGGAARKVFGFDRAIGAYTLTPDGNTLFFSARDEIAPVVKKMADKGFDANVIDEDVPFTRLYRVDLTAASPSAKGINLDGNVSDFAVSPDGARLVVALAETPLIGDDIINRKYSVVNASSGATISTLQTEGKIGAAAFSPDGSTIALLAGLDRTDPIAHTLAVADPDTGAVRFLTGEDEADEIDFLWKDNTTLTVLAHRGTSSETFEITIDGIVAKRRPQVGNVLLNIEGQAGTMAAVGMAPDHPRALYKQDGETFAKHTDYNAWVADLDLGNQEVVTWTAHDGVEVEGILVTPQGRKPRNGWPTILVVHGGPEAHYSNGWITRYSDPGHFGAGDGYAVFYPNYRGSTGRGQTFAKLDHQDAPAAEFNDYIDGLEYLANEGIVDPDRVGITGGSYGGYASAWGATAQSEHFKAAVIFVALTDLISFSGTTDISEEMVVSHFRDYPEGNWQTYLEQSPVYHASKSKTPSLILHGEADPRVHPSQSLELYRYLKRVGEAPVRLVTYPDEGHGNRKAAAQYDYALRLMRWMDRFVKQNHDNLPPTRVPEIEKLMKGD